jgi:hypothetical protein
MTTLAPASPSRIDEGARKHSIPYDDEETEKSSCAGLTRASMRPLPNPPPHVGRERSEAAWEG